LIKFLYVLETALVVMVPPEDFEAVQKKRFMEQNAWWRKNPRER
jgi:hypothetical protein